MTRIAMASLVLSALAAFSALAQPAAACPSGYPVALSLPEPFPGSDPPLQYGTVCVTPYGVGYAAAAPVKALCAILTPWGAAAGYIW